jgi:glucose/mannose transport system permease protein
MGTSTEFAVTSGVQPTATAHRESAATRRVTLRIASSLALIPAASIVIVCFYLFLVWTVYISFTDSHLLPSYELTGFHQYRRLFESDRWWTAMRNLGLYSGSFICVCTLLGFILALLIDRGIRWEKLARAIFMLPLALSFVVTGVIWQWLLNPTLGVERIAHDLGWQAFEFDWLVRSDRSIYTIALAAVWQQTGMCMALFLAGMRGIDPAIWRVAQVDGIPPWRVYVYIVVPMLRPVFFTALVLLFAVAAKSYDLVVTLTGGGPGFSSDLPSRYIIDLIGRQELGLGAAGAIVLLGTIAAVIGPYLYVEMRKQRYQ